MFLSLISGSSGNATLISDEKTTILVDCGMSGKRLEQTLASIHLSPKEIDAIFITHEHIDHTAGAGVICRRYQLPLYATAGTLSAMADKKIPDSCVHIIRPNCPLELGSIAIRPFSISHDASDPVGFRMSVKQETYAIATDTGVMTPEIYENLLGADAVLLESNHDPDLLMYGTYPYPLKRRIQSSKGHLSNPECAKTVVDLAKNGTKHIMLGHLSKENNTPQIAYKTAENALLAAGAAKDEIHLCVAERSEVTRLI